MNQLLRNALVALTMTLGTLALPGSSLAQVIVYTNDFEGVVGPEWSSTSVATTPLGSRNFLGEFANGTVSLALTGLPDHAEVTVSFDLFIIRSMDGNWALYGPDFWELSVVDGPTLLQTTFSNFDCEPPLDPTPCLPEAGFQAYPGWSGASYPAHTGATEVNTLGYVYGYTLDSVYTLDFAFPHTAADLVLRFSGSNMQGVWDESWGIDNVEVQVAQATPSLSCTGFEPPMASGPVMVKGNRALPLKAQLFDADGYVMTDADLASPPVIQIWYEYGTPAADDVTGDALPAGQSTEGNQFFFDSDQRWHYNLRTKNYSAAGTYTVLMDSGDAPEYLIDPTCAAEFVRN